MKNLILIALGLLMMSLNGCKKDESDPLEALQDDLTNGTWFISALTVDNNEITGQFEKFRITFTLEKETESPQEIFNKVMLSSDSISVSGTWIFMAAGPEEDYNNFLSIAFLNNNEFHKISARWGIESHTKGKVELKKTGEELSTDTRIMVLEKQ